MVEEVGPGVTSVAPGDHVVLALYGPCLACRNCLSGNPVHCNGPARVKAITGEMADGSTRLSSRGERVFPFVGQRHARRGVGAAREPGGAGRTRRPAGRDLPGRAAASPPDSVRCSTSRRCVLGRRSPSSAAAEWASASSRAPGSPAPAQIIAVDTNPLKLELARGMGATDEVLLEDRRARRGGQPMLPRRGRRRVRGGGQSVTWSPRRSRAPGRAGAASWWARRRPARRSRSTGACCSPSGGCWAAPAAAISPPATSRASSGSTEPAPWSSKPLSRSAFPSPTRTAAFAAAQAGQVARAVVVMDPALAQKGGL